MLVQSAIGNRQSAIRNPQSAICNLQSAICNLQSEDFSTDVALDPDGGLVLREDQDAGDNAGGDQNDEHRPPQGKEPHPAGLRNWKADTTAVLIQLW